MSVYTVLAWSNGDPTLNESGDRGEFDMSTELDTRVDIEGATEEDIRLRMLEALNHNLASIAQSLEGIRYELHDLKALSEYRR